MNTDNNTDVVKLTFSQYLKDKGFNRFYVSNVPIKRYDESGSTRIKQADYKKYEEEFDKINPDSITYLKSQNESLKEQLKKAMNALKVYVEITKQILPAVVQSDAVTIREYNKIIEAKIKKYENK